MVRRRDLATGGIVALLAVVSALYAPQLPEEMAIHFDAAGEPDSYMATELALAGGIALTAGIAVMFAVLPRIDPLGENFEAFQGVYDASAVGIVAFMAYVHGLVLAYNLDVEFGMLQALSPAIAGLYLLVAVLVRRAEQNWFVGIRTPWTLSDERVWNRTHERAAPLFVVAAALALAGVVVPEYAVLLISAPAAVIAFGATVYSFVVYRRLDPA
jgi:uncharacterized membrane protein